LRQLSKVARNQPGSFESTPTLGPVFTCSIARSASTNVAVDLYRVPAELNREAYLPHLATSMNNLANRLAEAGRYERALILAREAAAPYHDLARTNPDVFGSTAEHTDRLVTALVENHL
jgi:hypothetical protein